MHLTDEELLELNETGRKHLMLCAECNQKAMVLVEMRQQLSQQPSMSDIPDFKTNWQHIKQVHHHNKNEQFNDEIKINAIKVQRKLTFWRLASISLAASFAIVILIKIYSTQMSDFSQSQEIELARWIEKNHQVQQELTQRVSLDLVSRISTNQLQLDLADIDASLQIAYLKHSDNSEKLKLWRQRKEIIENYLLTITNIKKSTTISI